MEETTMAFTPTNEIPIILLDDAVLFPQLTLSFKSSNKLLKAINEDFSQNEKKIIGAVAKKEDGTSYQIGTLAEMTLEKREGKEDENYYVLNLEASRLRFKILELKTHWHKYQIARIILLQDETPKTEEEKTKLGVLLYTIDKLWTNLVDTMEQNDLYDFL